MSETDGQARLLRGLGWALWLLGLPAALLVVLGLLVRVAWDPWDLGDPEQWMHPLAAALVVAATVLGRWLLSQRVPARTVSLVTVSAGLGGVLLLGVLDAAAWVLFPRWPARALHGVAPAPGTNSWGQKDVEHAATPTSGVTRVVMVGDSFLEEGEDPVLPTALQEELGPTFETVNLGVSATGPDEYHYRAVHLGLPLKPARVVMLLYSGNDFMWHRSLHTWWGIMATAPRPSALSLLGLGPLEHVWMNRLRAYVRAWGAAGEMAAAERALFERVKAADDEALRRLVVDRAPESIRARVAQEMAAPDATRILEALRNPPQGKFRSYYLGHTFDAHTRARTADDSTHLAVMFTQRTAAMCRAAGVAFTVAVVPEAAAVDDAFVQTWRPLADLRRYLVGKDEAHVRAVKELKDAGLHVVDLRAMLTQEPGAYLVLDGHMAQRGQRAVARALAHELRTLH
jgi:hypothetical protein